jgi:hypothetical protein
MIETVSFGTTLWPLVALACPVGMGLMMFFMAKGMGGGQKQQDSDEVARLRAEQERLAAEVDRLESERQRDEAPTSRT